MFRCMPDHLYLAPSSMDTLTLTLYQGEELIANTYTDKLVIDGNDAFMLYDTFGFPLDLTDLMAEERDMKVPLTLQLSPSIPPLLFPSLLPMPTTCLPLV